MTWIFLKTYQIKVIFSQKILCMWQNKILCGKMQKSAPQKMKKMYLCERLNLYELIMQTAFVTNISHIKMQKKKLCFHFQ
jgi:hypothetical protein